MISVILAAAGSGARAGLCDNKIFYEIDGLPVIVRTLSAFASALSRHSASSRHSERSEESHGQSEVRIPQTQSPSVEFLVACRKEDEARLAPLLRPFGAKTVIGGKTRFESVYNALKAAKGDIVLVHDGARPFVSERAIENCIESVKRYGSGVCAVPASDTVALAENGVIRTVPARESAFLIQTPQGFLREELLAAYEQARTDGNASFTDESGVYARYIRPPHLADGNRENRKLTFAEDFPPHGRVGFGVDTHSFYAEGEGAPLISFITLGGVRVPSVKILKAHSDGDVLLHALTDALLSAAGLRDIGYYFPDTDEKYAGINSAELLKEVLARVRERGLIPYNASIFILAETPRLSPHIEAIKQNLSELLQIPVDRIGVAAGTNEKLGYIGEGKGITVYAYVQVHTCQKGFPLSKGEAGTKGD